MTLSEYMEAPRKQRLIYRMYRNPFVMFLFGPLMLFLIDYRVVRKGAGRKEQLHTHLTNLTLAGIVVTLCLTLGWKEFLIVQVPIMYLAAMGGIWLFYVQHQFEHSYYEDEKKWDYVKAALQGSSFYKLPRLLQWFSGNIGFHHVHHLNSRVPNYYLEQAHGSDLRFQNAPTLTIRSSLKSLQFRVWDEETKKFIGYRELKRRCALQLNVAS